ncbi:MAG: aldo/keto reductase [Planctomycetota bacterium]|jgi:predicted oxidoreductase|nr:aldo/keto reductase [Planctomycetota bacterium]
MKKINLGNSEAPCLAVGCMRMNALKPAEAAKFVSYAVENGANFFDHADIYPGSPPYGVCESIFAAALADAGIKREAVIIQSKCGIVPGVMYDFSLKHILDSVDGILGRLRTDYLDLLLLHRPDALAEPEEIAAAFDRLHSSGKVRQFGVSNHTPYQIELLKKHVKPRLIVNQLQLSITNASMIAQSMHMNTLGNDAVSRDLGVLDYCRLHDITIQPWSPFQYGFFEGVFLGSPKFPALNQVLDGIAAKYNVSNTALAVAWLIRHPAKFQPIIGSMNAARLGECIAGTEITLTREEWYAIHAAAGYSLL